MTAMPTGKTIFPPPDYLDLLPIHAASFAPA